MTIPSMTTINGHTLFFSGNLARYDQNPWVAVIGGRNPQRHPWIQGKPITPCSETAYAMEKIIDFIANNGYGIINGIAKGIDHMALTEAQKRGVPTIGVIAGGLSVPHYPKETRETRAQCTLVVSEYPDHTPIEKAHFLARNRVIIDLADVVVAFDGGNGTASAVRYAKHVKPVVEFYGSLVQTIVQERTIPSLSRDVIHTIAQRGYEERQFLRNQKDKG